MISLHRKSTLFLTSSRPFCSTTIVRIHLGGEMSKRAQGCKQGVTMRWGMLIALLVGGCATPGLNTPARPRGTVADDTVQRREMSKALFEVPEPDADTEPEEDGAVETEPEQQHRLPRHPVTAPPEPVPTVDAKKGE